MLESKGYKRGLASFFAILACAAPQVAILAPYAELLIQVSGILGGFGLAHAGISKVKKK